MKIAISATEPSLDAAVDPRFGRCQYFIIVDPETMLEFEAVENTNIAAGGGAGTGAAQIIAEKGAEVVLTGSCGPKAYQALAAAGIQVITGVAGRVWDAIEGYKSGRYQPTSGPTAPPHSGMGGGMGRGGGMRQAMSMGPGMSPAAGPAPQPNKPQQEVEALKQQAHILRQQLEEVERRLSQLGR